MIAKCLNADHIRFIQYIYNHAKLLKLLVLYQIFFYRCLPQTTKNDQVTGY